ncbi:MAG: molybdopterin dinucleotide binding domain-containing protein [Candidatus Altiarchaeota archaeon]
MIPEGFKSVRDYLRVKLKVILDTGSDSKQGVIMRSGRKMTHKDDYRTAAGTCYMNPEDMATLNVQDDGRVKLTSGVSSITLYAKAGETPRGIVFVPKGPWINSIVEAETLQTGSPNFKGMTITVEPTKEEVPDVEEIIRGYSQTREKA